jgi:hypothetical protein
MKWPPKNPGRISNVLPLHLQSASIKRIREQVTPSLRRP